MRIEGAFWVPEGGPALLTCDDLRRMDSPKSAILQFLESAYRGDEDRWLGRQGVPYQPDVSSGVSKRFRRECPQSVSEIASKPGVPGVAWPCCGSATKGARIVAQQEYEQSQTMGAPSEEVFAWLSDVGNLPKYLPPVVDASIEGPSAEGTPGQRVRATLEYPGGGTFVAEGYFAVDGNRRRMEWGAEVQRDYSGWLEVAESGDGQSRVTVHLNFGERSVEPQMREQAPEDRDPLGEGIAATLESIRRQIEEGSGKVEPPPPSPGTEPRTNENPAVVEENPS